MPIFTHVQDVIGNARLRGVTANITVSSASLDYLQPDAAGAVAFQGQNFRVANPATDSVKFGLWDHAFTAHSTLLNAAAESGNFIGSDTRRFHLRVTDPASRGKGAVTAKWWTVFDDKSTIMDSTGNDQITLLENSITPGEFVSRGLMLVRFADELRISPQTGLPAGGAARRGQSDFRVRRGGMFGFVAASYKSLPPVFMPVCQPSERKRLPIHVFVFRNASGNPVIDPSGPIADTMFWARLRFAADVYETQGVFLQTAPYTASSSLNPVAATGSTPIQYEVNVVDAPSLVNVGAFDVINDPARVAFAFREQASKLRVFFIDSFAIVTLLGFSIAKSAPVQVPRMTFSSDMIGCSFVKGSSADMAAAHELGHTLMDKLNRLTIDHKPVPMDARTGVPADAAGHFTTPGEPLTEVQNLMGLDMLHQATGFDGTRRLWNANDADGFNQLDELMANRLGLLVT